MLGDEKDGVMGRGDPNALDEKRLATNADSRVIARHSFQRVGRHPDVPRTSLRRSDLTIT